MANYSELYFKVGHKTFVWLKKHAKMKGWIGITNTKQGIVDVLLLITNSYDIKKDICTLCMWIGKIHLVTEINIQTMFVYTEGQKVLK